MSKFAFLISLLVSSTTVYAQGVHWRSWENGFSEAEKTGKIVMVDVVRNGCHYCTDMHNEVFKDINMAAYIEEKFIPIKINLSYEKMPIETDVSMTPTFFFFDSKKRIIKKIPGSWNKEDFLNFLDNIHK